jgi:hypothetical protein
MYFVFTNVMSQEVISALGISVAEPHQIFAVLASCQIFYAATARGHSLEAATITVSAPATAPDLVFRLQANI